MKNVKTAHDAPLKNPSKLRKPPSKTPYKIVDIKPHTPTNRLDRNLHRYGDSLFSVDEVASLVGMSKTFIFKVLGKRGKLSSADVLELLDQDAFAETFVPRSKILDYLNRAEVDESDKQIDCHDKVELLQGDALDLVRGLQDESIACVVTSTPYWAMRIYDQLTSVSWADGEICPFGMEQTPEGFIRHSVEMLNALHSKLAPNGSIWWNLMDTYNTRTQIRGNAAEALRAMQGKETRGWHEYECRRYSAGHSYLEDGEQALIPGRIAERASRLGYLIKSTISWGKTSSLPEPQTTRVSRNVEYILHITKQRAPHFDKEAYNTLPIELGGRNKTIESAKLSDLWQLPTSSGRDGHGAQFPLALPGRCIGLSTKKGDLVLDPFVGAGTSGVAAVLLGRRFIGFEASQTYLSTAENRIGIARSGFNMREKLEHDAQVALTLQP